jgi:tetratricopeptide (TPR) repeat protein
MSTAARRYYLRGRRSLELGEIEPAIEALASAVDLAPHFIDARIAHATALCRLGDVPRAAQTLRAGLGHARTEPARAALWLSLGEVLTTGGDFIAAEDAFNQAALHPAYASRAAAGRARVLAKSGRTTDAIRSLLRAVGRASLLLLALALPGCKGGSDKPKEKPPAPAPARPPPAPAPPPDPTIVAAGEPPPSVTPAHKALAEKVLADMEAIAAFADASQGNCQVVAAAMKAEMDKARPDIEAMEKIEHEATDKEARAWFERAYGSRMMALMGKIINVAKSCREDPDFQAAMADSPFGKQKSAPPPPPTPPPTPPTPTATTRPAKK